MKNALVHAPFRRLSVGALALALCFAVGAPSLQAQQKMAVIDVQKILEDSVLGKKVIEELTQLRAEKAATLQETKTKFDDAQKRYNDGRLTLSSDKLAAMEKELEDLSIELRRRQDDAQRELQQKQAEEFGEIEAQVMPIIGSLGQELGYTMIFNKFQSGLVWADDAVDITDMVVERFNASSGN
jgi:outer membrane protein